MLCRIELPRSVQKDQDDVKDGTLWGLALEGNRGTVGMDGGKRMALAYITLKAAHMPISQKGIRTIGGALGCCPTVPTACVFNTVICISNQRSQPYPPKDASLGYPLGAGNACFGGTLGGIRFAGPAS